MKKEKRWPDRLSDLLWGTALAAGILLLLFTALWFFADLLFLGAFR